MASASVPARSTTRHHRTPDSLGSGDVLGLALLWVGPAVAFVVALLWGW